MKPNILDLAKQTKALAEKATPGEWGATYSYVQNQKGGICTASQTYEIYRDESYANAEFIAHSRTAAPQLADAVVELSGQLSSLREQVAALQIERDEMLRILNKLSKETRTVIRCAYREDGDPMKWTEEEPTRLAEEASKLLTRLGASETSDMSEANTEGE
jgi:hypothetical protein